MPVGDESPGLVHRLEGGDVNTATLDRDEYRLWWEAEGRADLDTCPCGQPAGEDSSLASDAWGTPPRASTFWGSSRPGFCGRHAAMTADRETFAAAIISGVFFERDLTEEETDKVLRVVEGRPRFDA